MPGAPIPIPNNAACRIVPVPDPRFWEPLATLVELAHCHIVSPSARSGNAPAPSRRPAVISLWVDMTGGRCQASGEAKVNDQSESDTGQHTGTAHRDSTRDSTPVCADFLYGFKAAPRGRSRRRLGSLAVAPADAPAPAGQNHAGRLARRDQDGCRLNRGEGPGAATI